MGMMLTDLSGWVSLEAVEVTMGHLSDNIDEVEGLGFQTQEDF